MKSEDKYGILRTSGDEGFSDLFSGERVSKGSLRMEALGEIDELGAVLGIARAHCKNKKTIKALEDIQQGLFRLGAEVATTEENKNRLKNVVDQGFLASFEKTIEDLYEKTEMPKNFIVPGENLAAAYLNYARTIARRCERRFVQLFEDKEISNTFILPWLNRLSVYLYLLTLNEDDNPQVLKDDN